jgi:AAA+ superfamily predicted ATPase
MRFALPDRETVAKILESAVAELAVQWPALLPLAKDAARIAELAALCEGWDGRRIRKLVLAALAQRLEVARDPAKLAWDDFLAAARKKGGVEWAGGTAPTAREMFPDVPRELMHDHDHGHRPTHTHQHDDDEDNR